MPKRAITDLFLSRIRPPKTGRIGYGDTHQPGLILRVSASGAMSWCVLYRVDGRRIRETIGSAYKIPVAEARLRAAASLAAARGGRNPVKERRAAATRAAANTVAAATERWFEICERDLRPKTVSGYRQLFQHDVLPRWADRPLASITKGDVLELIHGKAMTRARARPGTSNGATVQANRLLARLRTFFAWCVSQDLMTANPTIGVIKPAKEKPRDRILGDDELRAFWVATGNVPVGGVAWGAMFRLLLLTGQRRGEVAGMQWSELDLDNRVWQIPGARTKNEKPHTVHLSELAMQALADVPHRGPFVFSGTRRTPASGFSNAKARLDKAMGAKGWVIHDLRRTATTCMARLGIAPHVADKVLNHTAGTIAGVARVYNRFEYLEERKAALEALGRFVADLVGTGGSDNVVALRR
jgi:integrase